MVQTEHDERTALPLAEAAAQLGLSPDALRMRLRRGRAKGFKRGGRLFVIPNDGATEGVRIREQPSEQEPPVRSPRQRHGQAPESRHDTLGIAGEDPVQGAGSAGEVPEAALPVVIEFQRVELTRLLRDNARLNQRLDQVMEEVRHLREMQQREQILRQKDQALREQVQALLGHLSEQLSLSRGPAAAVARRGTAGDRLAAGMGSAAQSRATSPPPMTEPPPAPMAERVPPQTVRARAPGSAAPGTRPEVSPQGAPGNDRGHAADGPRSPRDEPARPTATQTTTSPVPDDSYAYGRERGADGADLDPMNQAADLAEMLKEVGRSLRDVTPPDPAPGAPAERPAPSTSAPPKSTAATSTTPPGFAAGQAADAATAAGGIAGGGTPLRPPPVGGTPLVPPDLPGPTDDDDGNLLEILGRMGPSAEDRRTAARIMKRLLRKRRGGSPKDQGPPRADG